MRTISFDTETALILKGLAHPPIACFTWAERVNGEMQSGIVDRHDAPKLLRRWVEDDNVQLVGHHTQYDTVGVANEDNSLLEPLFHKHEKLLVTDTILRERLYDLSRGLLSVRKAGYYTLENLIKKRFKVDLDKHTWRTGYGKLIHTPLEQWPPGAIKYAVDDAVWTLLLKEKQDEFGFADGRLLDDTTQTKTGFALQLMHAWGVRTDPERVPVTKQRFVQAYDTFRAELMSNKDEHERSILRSDGTQDMAFTKELVLRSYTKGQPPLTDKGIELQKEKKLFDPKKYISTSAETIADCNHPFLTNLKSFDKVKKVLTTFIPVIERGTQLPICARINTLVKNGRMSWGKPNLQNLPREGGVRECFIPRPGYVFVNADYDTLEVRTFAQVLHDMGIGDTLLRAYQQDPDFDPHSRLAAQILKISYAEAMELKKSKNKAFKDMRQRCKAASFGYPGGMGAATFIEYAKAYGLLLTLKEAEDLKKAWRKSVPEVGKYFKWVSKLCKNGYATVSQIRSGRVRGGCTYTDLANTMWSGLAADGVKLATFNIARACYIEKDSPLYGSRPVVVVHDEFILETPEHKASAAGPELSRIMQSSMEEYTPNIPSRASAALMRRWYKDADPAFDVAGQLIPWEPSA